MAEIVINEDTEQTVLADEELIILSADPALQGETGVQGIQGVTGLSGVGGSGVSHRGQQGETGLMGSSGIKGDRGSTGPHGLRGQQGDTGIAGIKGETGFALGVRGLTGANGITGSVGSAGQQGITGLLGLPGQDGVDGLTGANGITGSVGSDGQQGITGLPGQDGADGITGYAGPDGITGANGITGPGGLAIAFVSNTEPSPPVVEGTLWYDNSVSEEKLLKISYEDNWDVLGRFTTEEIEMIYDATLECFKCSSLVLDSTQYDSIVVGVKKHATEWANPISNIAQMGAQGASLSVGVFVSSMGIGDATISTMTHQFCVKLTADSTWYTAHSRQQVKVADGDKIIVIIHKTAK